ncbi:MAG TPA: ester cyclase [Chitinophagaceae bacterium]|nr:ester cyclase [Chitinophagaceae bacterium]
MKKLLFMGAITMLFLASCNDKDAASNNGNSAADKAKANNRAVLKAIETGDVSKLDSFITSDGVDHSGAGGMMETKGIDNIKKDLGSMKQDFSEIKFDIQQEAVNGDYLFILAKMTGTTSANAGHGLPPNQKIEMSGVDVLKFNSEGKFTDHWTFNDPRDMMKMMGGGKPMDNKMAADTTKK